MSLPVKIRPQAERDIQECFVYIAEDNFDIGLKFLQAVESTFDQLEEFPLIGQEIDLDIEDAIELRVWRVKNFEAYLVIYGSHPKQVEVVRLLHHARDIKNILK